MAPKFFTALDDATVDLNIKNTNYSHLTWTRSWGLNFARTNEISEWAWTILSGLIIYSAH